jgi:hypothetical protein
MESVCSLRSLVSSDEISLDHNTGGVGDEIRNYDYHPEGIPSTIRHRSLNTCTTSQYDRRRHNHHHRHHRHRRVSSQRSISTEMAIIASSSPEIKALTLPITTTFELPEEINCSGLSSSSSSSASPSSNEYHRHTTTTHHHQYRHQRSISTCSLFPEDFDCDSFSVSAKTKNKLSPTISPAVSPIDVDGVNNKEDYRDQDNYHPSMNRCKREREHDDDQRDGTLTKLSNDNNEIDELTLYLERQNIGSSDSIHSPTSLLHKKTPQLSSPTTIIPDVTVHPFKRGSSQQRPRPSFLEQRSSLHRRISFDSLPGISEIIDQPNLLPHGNEGYSYHCFSSGTTTKNIHHDNSFTPNENNNDTKFMSTIYY